MNDDLAKQLGIPILALLLGGFLLCSSNTAPAGKIGLFFGGNSMMNLYMKSVLSDATVSEEYDLKGVPAPFALTAIQQVVSFVLFAVWIMVSFPTQCRYSPKVLSTRREWGKVGLFCLAFTGNIALNNYGMQLLPLSVNLIIRSCLPAATIVVQIVMAKCQGLPANEARPLELALVAIGVLGAVAVVMSQMHEGDKPSKEHDQMLLGILVSTGALCFKALNLVLAALLGTTCKLNALDTTLYMSVPVALVLTAPVLTYEHTTWPGRDDTTDWNVIREVARYSPGTLVLVFASGVLALFYNTLSWNIVHDLSAGTLAFAENFNSSATIAIAVLVGLDHLPEGVWGVIFVVAVIACIGSFATYSYVKVVTRAAEAARAAQASALLASEVPSENLSLAEAPAKETSTQ
eukprot:TRINITY_DN81041_c0_g1_i1.p1 TRINITY_DN81041_c0_g1~~TRINITY_DN81041_c0_g1_i1.p1  ORF type:complete len:405 (+),score=40.00 TRINITY_DN81041_c0_g1_i1:86-1300(+)